ncbi:MAG: adenosylcobinamide-GDP ribazoletransferase [Eubacterium sp.]|jgi:adenosylcobinamide-GDP ribazoletransferase|nr:adenosylcobinamide-GDP ribazoletransferase [Eubacterium sp.]
MKTLINSLVLSFAVFSKIPLRSPEWKKENMRYIFCFFPLIGLVIGVLFFTFWYVSHLLFLILPLTSALLTSIPVLVTGGIHLDGFCDTMDAISSYKTLQKKLEILKDSRIGAFAAIFLCVYFIVFLGAASEIYNVNTAISVCLCFILSRAYSALFVRFTGSARQDGMIYELKSDMQKSAVLLSSAFYISICAAFLFFTNIFSLSAPLVGLLIFFFCRRKAIREFTGITGDVVGWFLCVSELFMICVAVLSNKLAEVITWF